MSKIIKKMVLFVIYGVFVLIFASFSSNVDDKNNYNSTKNNAIYHNIDSPDDINPIVNNTNENILNNEKISTASNIIATNSSIATYPNILISTNSQIFIHDGIKYIKGELVGEFKLTGYCACKKCTNGSGYTYSGKPVRENHTVAADRKILPIGTFIVLEGSRGWDTESYNGVYQVEDIGGGVKDKHIDIYRPTHDLAAYVTYYGYNYANVYIAIPIE